MKTFVVSAISIVLVSILSFPMVMAAPPMPDDVKIVQPDPSLPKEISAFWGKWQGQDSNERFFLIVEKIDEEKASLYLWRTGYVAAPGGWDRYEGKVEKERGKYILWFTVKLGGKGNVIGNLTGDYLNIPKMGGRFTRVP